MIILFMLASTSLALTNNHFNLVEEKVLPKQLGMYRHIRSDANRKLDIYIIKLNKNYHAALYQQNTFDKNQAESIHNLSNRLGYIIGINGSFFTKEFKPAGLFIENGKIVYNQSQELLLDTCVNNRNGKILLETNVKKCLTAFSAMQSGPALIEQGEVAADVYNLPKQLPQLKEFFEPHKRTVLALSDDNKLLIISTSPVTLAEIANTLKNLPKLFDVKAIKTAIDLDGGHSTGMYIRFNENQLYLPEANRVKTLIFIK